MFFPVNVIVFNSVKKVFGLTPAPGAGQPFAAKNIFPRPGSARLDSARLGLGLGSGPALPQAARSVNVFPR